MDTGKQLKYLFVCVSLFLSLFLLETLSLKPPLVYLVRGILVVLLIYSGIVLFRVFFFNLNVSAPEAQDIGDHNKGVIGKWSMCIFVLLMLYLLNHHTLGPLLADMGEEILAILGIDF